MLYRELFRMWSEETSRDMMEEGVNPEKVFGGKGFVENYSKVQIGKFREKSIVVFLRQDPLADHFVRSPDGDIYINVSFFHDIDTAAHIYIDYIVKSIKKHHAGIEFRIHWTSVDVYLNNIFSCDVAIRTHYHLALFHYFCRMHLSQNLIGRSDFLPIDLNSGPKFYARPGNVELRAVRTILRYPSEIPDICAEIAQNINSEEFMYKNNTSSDEVVGDHSFAIRQLITNAGFYAETKEDLISDLHAWCNRYISGLFGSHEIYMRWDYAMHSHVARMAAFEAGLTFRGSPRAIFGSIDEFYNQLAGKKVLMVSPFSEACEEAVATGRIKKIWKNRVVPDFQLVGLPAYISTYPNRPHRSWMETFGRMCRNIDEAVNKSHFDVAIASCGCYGIPILDYVYKKFGIASVYYGNMMHLFFGIKLNDFDSYFDAGNMDYWVEPFRENAGEPQNFGRIDGGRYIISQNVQNGESGGAVKAHQ